MIKKRAQRKRKKSLSLLFDDRFRFALGFTAAKAGKSLTQFIEECVWKATEGSGWEAFWHPSEGVRELLRLRYGTGQRTAADEELLAFVTAHDDLFFRDMAPRVNVLDALWPNIKVYLATWKQTRGTPDAEKAGKQMRAVIAKLPRSARA